jgi:hypothetical protein
MDAMDPKKLVAEANLLPLIKGGVYRGNTHENSSAMLMINNGCMG